MRFKKRTSDEPIIDIIPRIDVLMAILIFLMLTSTFNKFTEMQLQLPTADTEAARDYPKEVVIAISKEGHYEVNGESLEKHSTGDIANALRAAKASPESVLIIRADALAPHQTVVSAIAAARQLNVHKVTFATRRSE